MKELSPSELYIMSEIWKQTPPLTLEEIAFLVREKEWALNTLRNFIARIINKGYLRVDKRGRTNYYYPAVAAEDCLNKRSRNMLERLYDNSVKKMVAQLYESENLDLEDLKELKQYIEEQLQLLEE